MFHVFSLWSLLPAMSQRDFDSAINHLRNTIHNKEDLKAAVHAELARLNHTMESLTNRGFNRPLARRQSPVLEFARRAMEGEYGPFSEKRQTPVGERPVNVLKLTINGGLHVHFNGERVREDDMPPALAAALKLLPKKDG